ncbi:MAG TPA: hypothetical protein VLA09_02745, partial [Longimicrobiales bacterium]|nr:hypothetical protein [Longimicrobiales bacterium]
MRLQLGAVGLVLAAVACGAEPRETPEAAEPGAFEPEFRITATIEEVMRYMIDPSGDAIWEAVVTEVTPEGVNEMVPETDEDWIELRRHAMILIEATNLILMHDRPLAAPGSRSELPGVDLEPEEIQALLNANRPAWDQ